LGNKASRQGGGADKQLQTQNAECAVGRSGGGPAAQPKFMSQTLLHAASSPPKWELAGLLITSVVDQAAPGKLLTSSYGV